MMRSSPGRIRPRGLAPGRGAATLWPVKHTNWDELDARARAVLAAHDGIVHVTAFDGAGITRRQVSALQGRRVIERVRTGWYVDPDQPWQIKHAVRFGRTAACVTAAVLWGLPVPPAAHRVLHVVVDPHGSHFRHNRDARWVLALVEDDAEVEPHWGTCHDAFIAGRTSLVDTLLMLVGCVSTDWFVAALDAALHVPRGGVALLSANEFARFASLLPGRKRALLSQIDALAESCLETLLRLALLRRGITDFVLQAVPHPAYRVDFLLRGRLIVEVDGAAYHDPEQDRIRDDILRSLGYVVLRFPYDRIVGDLDAVLDEIEAALALL